MRALITKAIAEDDSGGEDADVLLRTHVPDHLPGSPLCPLDVRNKTGGKSICPLHGSRKTMQDFAQRRKGRAGGQRASLTSAVKREPEIVFDSGDGSRKY
jgi:hypothetical protein